MDHELSAPVQVDLHGRNVRAAEPPVPNGPPGHRGAPRPGSRPRATTGWAA